MTARMYYLLLCKIKIPTCGVSNNFPSGNWYFVLLVILQTIFLMSESGSFLHLDAFELFYLDGHFLKPLFL